MLTESPDEIAARYEAASENRLHPCSWIPPEWKGTAPPTLTDTVSAPVDLSNIKLVCDRAAEQHPEEQGPPKAGPGKTHGFQKWVHPDTDFSHNDPDLFEKGDLDIVGQKVGDTSSTYKKLTKLFGGGSVGMQRLACVFEWILCKSSALLADINKGIGEGVPKTPPNQTFYNTARENYIKFLQDLEEHEPRGRDREVVPGLPGKSGYGQALKWLHIFPLIFSGKIIGIRVVAQWNPHSSSNGIPIQHNPPP